MSIYFVSQSSQSPIVAVSVGFSKSSLYSISYKFLGSENGQIIKRIAYLCNQIMVNKFKCNHSKFLCCSFRQSFPHKALNSIPCISDWTNHRWPRQKVPLSYSVVKRGKRGPFMHSCHNVLTKTKRFMRGTFLILSSLFYSFHFSLGLWLSVPRGFLCSETARKRLLSKLHRILPYSYYFLFASSSLK